MNDNRLKTWKRIYDHFYFDRQMDPVLARESADRVIEIVENPTSGYQKDVHPS